VHEAKRRLLLAGLKLLDITLLLMSFGLAIVLSLNGRQSGSLERFLAMRIQVWNVVIFAAIVAAWHVVFCLCGMYQSKRFSTTYTQTIDALKSTTLSTAVLKIMAIFFSISMVRAGLVVLFWGISFVAITVGRLTLRFVLSKIRLRGRNMRYMLILGTNQRAVDFAGSIRMAPELGYRILGFVDQDSRLVSTSPGAELGLVCTLGSLPEFLRHNVVDEVVNYLPMRSFYEHAAQVASLCELHGIILRLNTDAFGITKSRSQAGNLNGHNYIMAYPGISEVWPLIAKRTVDILVSLAVLLLLAPLFATVVLLIKLTSPGPIFFLQDRVGYNKRTFRICKFRTMVPNAEKLMANLEKMNEASGPVFKIKDDPRITSVGKFLRRTSIDELPQLINVLKADMSLVGPRPLPIRDYQGFNEDWQRRRFSVKPGITCLWQVNGRSSITFDEWMRLDLQYMDEWSLWLDMKILARTIPAVLKGSGAV
jgi:exopolysaccharide biosynthesis polyprenyl glycosylphosphotransferase